MGAPVKSLADEVLAWIHWHRSQPRLPNNEDICVAVEPGAIAGSWNVCVSGRSPRVATWRTALEAYGFRLEEFKLVNDEDRALARLSRRTAELSQRSGVDDAEARVTQVQPDDRSPREIVSDAIEEAVAEAGRVRLTHIACEAVKPGDTLSMQFEFSSAVEILPQLYSAGPPIDGWLITDETKGVDSNGKRILRLAFKRFVE